MLPQVNHQNPAFCSPHAGHVPHSSHPTYFDYQIIFYMNTNHDLIFLWPCIMNWLYIITILMHWLLFIHKKLFSSTCFEPQVLIFRRIQLYTCSLWYCHSLWEFLVACRNRAQAVYWQEDTVVYMQSMVLSLSMRVRGGLYVHSSSCVPTGHQELS